MPEGAEVHCFADAIRNLIKGKELVTLNTSHNLKLPCKVLDVSAKGKKIIFTLENEQYFVSSLGLQGRWSTVKEKHVKIKLKFKDEALYYSDPISYGNFETYYSKNELNERLSKIGPDLLTGNVSVQEWIRVARTANKLEVCSFLLEQKYFSGVGNYVKAEALYRSRIRPDALVKQLEDKHLKALLRACTDVLNEAYEAQGASLHTYLTFQGEKGSFVCRVYGKEKDPKGREVIETMFKDGRVTHWVPEYQTLPGEWEGIERLSKSKLRATYQGEKGGYTLTDLKIQCHSRGLSVTGTKPILTKRLMKYKGYEF